MGEDLTQYRIKGSDLDWTQSLDGTKQKHLVSVKRYLNIILTFSLLQHYFKYTINETDVYYYKTDGRSF